jgi:hypothetical protein
MKNHHWNIGFYNNVGELITDVSVWAKNNLLDIKAITPVVWFGKPDFIAKCWSITPDTEDLFVSQFWGDYFEGALPYICKADEGLGYSVWEYGLDFDANNFNVIKTNCPINVDLTKRKELMLFTISSLRYIINIKDLIFHLLKRMVT